MQDPQDDTSDKPVTKEPINIMLTDHILNPESMVEKNRSPRQTPRVFGSVMAASQSPTKLSVWLTSAFHSSPT